MLELKQFEANEKYTKVGRCIERVKATHYIRRVKKEIEFTEKEKSVIEERLQFLYAELESALRWRLLH